MAHLRAVVRRVAPSGLSAVLVALVSACGGAADPGSATSDGGGSPQADAGATVPDTGAPIVDASLDAPDAANGCTVLLDAPGLFYESTANAGKKATTLPATGGTSWQRIDVSLDVSLVGWTPKQGQYEVFTLMRGSKWVGNAIGYVAFNGPASRQTIMVANLNLPFAAAKDGRRITQSYAYAAPESYHVEYTYDVANDVREVRVFVMGNLVTKVTGKVSVPAATPPVTSVDVLKEGMVFLVGGQEGDPAAPDATTLGWRFSNPRIVGCK
jgi:hypothetical protein